MLYRYRCFFVFILFTNCLFSERISTFYGDLEVEEPLLLELIYCPAMQRLKEIHQYGVSYYTKTHPEEYTRFDHSLGVFAILRKKKASLEEQIAGLLHDVSHTVFSHVGDWVYSKENREEDYQSSIHDFYLVRFGIEEILNRYGYQVEHVSPKRKEFVMLEQPLPNLCADRIDYNIQGAYFQGFITKEEAKELVSDLVFENGKWILSNPALAAKITQFSLVMTENCWGSAENFMTSRWLAYAILQGFKIGVISWDDFHFGTDQMIWDRLLTSQDPVIQNYMQMVLFPKKHYRLVHPNQATTFLKFRFRGIDPWIAQNGKISRLTSLNSALNITFQKTQQQSIEGWPVQILENPSLETSSRD